MWTRPHPHGKGSRQRSRPFFLTRRYFIGYRPEQQGRAGRGELPNLDGNRLRALLSPKWKPIWVLYENKPFNSLFSSSTQPLDEQSRPRSNPNIKLRRFVGAFESIVRNDQHRKRKKKKRPVRLAPSFEELVKQFRMNVLMAALSVSFHWSSVVKGVSLGTAAVLRSTPSNVYPFTEKKNSVSICICTCTFAAIRESSWL